MPQKACFQDNAGQLRTIRFHCCGYEALNFVSFLLESALSSVQKLFLLVIYVKSTVVRTKHQASLAYASKHHALTEVKLH